MVLFPNCKINLGLRVAGKRDDGYHNLETVFCPIPLHDAAEIITGAIKKEHEPFELIITGAPVPGDQGSNLCVKAWQLLKNDFPDMPPMRMYLHKAIPVGAGLGGGSADGAFTLLLLNEALKLNLSTEKLIDYALQLGSDCPFFILNKPVYATGRGEVMEEVTIGLDEYYFVLINPGIHVNTGGAFRELEEIRRNGNRAEQAMSLKEIVALPVSAWRKNLVNDFEASVFNKFPRVALLKQTLYDAGAEYASMTGTGSTVYGIFHKSKKSGNLKTSETDRVYILNQEH